MAVAGVCQLNAQSMELTAQSIHLNSMQDNKVIILSELIEQRLRKEKEIEYYQNQLIEFQNKITHLQKDVDLTKIIIDIIQSENIIDIQDKVIKSIPIIGDNKDGSQRSK